MKTAPWDEINDDIRLGLFLVTANAQAMVGYDHLATGALGRTVFGPDFPADGFVTSHISELEDLAAYSVEHTGFWKIARACHDFVLDNTTPLDKIDHGYIEAEYGNWLNHFLTSIPSDSYATHLGDLHTRFLDRNPEYPLPQLARATSSKLNLIAFLRSPRFEITDGIGFAPWEIAELGGMTLAGVRNFIGPKGSDKPMKSRPLEHDNKAVYAEPLDALEWLAGRRSFDVGPLSPDWVADVAEGIDTPQMAGAVAGIFAWINRITTEKLSQRLDADVSEIHAWTRGELSGGADRAAGIADALGFDPDLYRAIVDRALTAPLKP